MKTAKRVASVKPSPTLAIDGKAKALIAQGVDVVGFGAGEPDFDTPQNIKNAAIAAINSGFTKYCPVGGTDSLKDAVIAKLKRDNSLAYERANIIVSCGAKHSIYNIFQAIIDDGDEVIVPSPYWVSYPDMVALAGGVSRIVGTSEENGFKISAQELEKAITPKTKALVLNSPSNPTGAAYSKKELEDIADVVVKHGITVISDDIYEKLLYDDLKFHTIASVSEKMKELTLVVNGVSKAYAMTGWRIGYVAGDKGVISAMTTIQSQSTSNPTSIALKAAEEALNGPQDAVSMMLKEFDKRRRHIVERLNGIQGISCRMPEGAFYVFPCIKGVLGKSAKTGKIVTSEDFVKYLLDEHKVAVVHGSAFGAEGYMRLSYATSMANIDKGLDRIEKAVSELS